MSEYVKPTRSRARKKMPRVLIVGELMLTLVLFRYLINFTSIVSPVESTVWRMIINFVSILFMLGMSVLVVRAILGVPSARPQSWRSVVRSSILLFISNWLLSVLDLQGIIYSGFIMSPELVAVPIIIAEIIMFLPSVRKFYTPPFTDTPPLKSWLLYLINIPMINAESYRLVCSESEE
ncbi:hypothetical protein PED39_03205 [Methanomassiliicoccales archaeon LGM-RCC1]|nr:hypothetical protein [Candidatus Methanomethylophilaceae archaeon]WII08224.1 hypothetical protein PED39_03205 [Methanomassiliicoccales archaeon LGM-RCC1]